MIFDETITESSSQFLSRRSEPNCNASLKQGIDLGQRAAQPYPIFLGVPPGKRRCRLLPASLCVSSLGSSSRADRRTPRYNSLLVSYYSYETTDQAPVLARFGYKCKSAQQKCQL